MFTQAAAATSPQSQVGNTQSQQGEVVVDHTVDVVDVYNDVAMTSVGTGNTFTGSVIGQSLNVVSTQDMGGNATVTSRLNLTGTADGLVVQSAAVTGNDGESNALSGATLTASSTQTVGAVNINVVNDFNGGSGQAGGVTNTALAIANSQGYGASGSTASYTVNQSSAALTQAVGGGTLGHSDGTALFSALATSNNVTGTGTDNSTQTANITQTMTGTRTQASVFANVGTGQDLVTQSTVTANNVSITNDTGPLNVVTSQNNQGYVLSQATMTAYEFGSAQTNAYGVGNSVMAGNVGVSTTIDNTQTNSGAGVEARASFSGGGGYDAYAAATAIGNAVTGFACTACGGQITATNRQTNTADVGATSTVAVAGYNRSTASTATATGNSASFYVSTPSGN
jgi:hypothetical protein